MVVGLLEALGPLLVRIATPTCHWVAAAGGSAGAGAGGSLRQCELSGGAGTKGMVVAAAAEVLVLWSAAVATAAAWGGGLQRGAQPPWQAER
jgi:hypothetical protein